ncbi:MAG: CHAT domain-containing tetratricopeptide repeat protein [Myxococcota bacterium]
MAEPAAPGETAESPALREAAALHKEARELRKKGRYDEALPLVQRSLKIREKALGPDHPDVAASLNNLAILHRSRGEYDEALPLYKRSLAIREKAQGPDHPDVAGSLNNLARLHESRGEYDEALPLQQRSLAIKEKALGPDHPRVARSLNNLAILRWATGSPVEATHRFHAAAKISAEHIMRSTASDSLASRRKFLASLNHQLDDIVTFALDTKAARASRLAYSVLAGRKGQIVDSASTALAGLRSRLNPADRELLAEYRSKNSQYTALLLRGPGRTSPEAHRGTLRTLSQRIKELEQLISTRSREFRNARREVTVAGIQSRIPRGVVLIEWLLYKPYQHRAPSAADLHGPDRYAAAIVRATGNPIWLDLGPAEPIDQAVAALRRALAARMYSAKDMARSLDALVMAPVRARLGDTRQLLLAPDSALHLVPFEALVDEQGRYLVENYDLSYLGSGRDLLREFPPAPRSAGLIIADPRFDVPGLKPTRHFQPLNGTAAEARAIHSRFSAARLLTGTDATTTAMQELSGPAFVHLATHGYFQSLSCGEQTSSQADDPMVQSGLALAGANTCQPAADKTHDDGLLTAHELATLDLHGTKLAVLSACDTGVGLTEIAEDESWTTGRGQGVYGLRRALVLAGAETQVVSLWRVEDRATRDLMIEYYDRLARGEGRAQAMRAIQRAWLASEERNHPHYWAPFIVSGQTGPLDLSQPTLKPTLPATSRGPRGCACEAGAGPSGNGWWWIVAVLMLVAWCRPRRPRYRAAGSAWPGARRVG